MWILSILYVYRDIIPTALIDQIEKCSREILILNVENCVITKQTKFQFSFNNNLFMIYAERKKVTFVT